MIFDSSAYLLEEEGTIEAVSSLISPANTTTGLGFERRRARETGEALAHRLEEKQRRHKKAKREASGAERARRSEAVSSHGTQDEDEEELLSRRYKKPSESVPAINLPAHASSSSVEIDVGSAGVTSVGGDPIESRTHDDPEPTSEERAGERRRRKTRSKQKNIRRDRRPDHLKPEYIRNGEGRPLSEATVARLNLLEKSSDTIPEVLGNTCCAVHWLTAYRLKPRRVERAVEAPSDSGRRDQWSSSGPSTPPRLERIIEERDLTGETQFAHSGCGHC